MAKSEIARHLGRDRRTIGREVERGQVHLNSDPTPAMCVMDRAQDVYHLNATSKGPTVKPKTNRCTVEEVYTGVVKLVA